MYVHTLHLHFTMPLSSLIKIKSLKLWLQRNSIIAQEHLGFQRPWSMPLPSDQATLEAAGSSESRRLQHPQACDNTSALAPP